ELAPLLDDPVAEVRQAAILAVGPARDVVNTEDLLRALHDPDPDVRRLCEVMLLGDRGLRQEDVILGRLISDARPEVRLKVLDRLRPASDTEPGVWLRRLSQDPVPAVRAAALRAVAEQPLLDFSERLQQM